MYNGYVVNQFARQRGGFKENHAERLEMLEMTRDPIGLVCYK